VPHPVACPRCGFRETETLPKDGAGYCGRCGLCWLGDEPGKRQLWQAGLSPKIDPRTGLPVD
jgi:hypothetical protein